MAARAEGICEEVDLETVRVIPSERRRPAGICEEEEPARCRRSDRRNHGEKTSAGDGGRATDAALWDPQDVAARPEGIWEEFDLETMRVSPTERRRPAGICGEEEPARCRRSDRRNHGEKTSTGDGGPALDAALWDPQAYAESFTYLP